MSTKAKFCLKGKDRDSYLHLVLALPFAVSSRTNILTPPRRSWTGC